MLATTALFVAGGCRKDEPRRDVASTTEITGAQLGTTGAPRPVETAADPRGEYARIARGDLDNLDRRIILLEGRAQAAAPGTREQALADLRAVRGRFVGLSSRVDAVPNMSPAAFNSEQGHLEADWELLNERVDRIGAMLSERP